MQSLKLGHLWEYYLAGISHEAQFRTIICHEETGGCRSLQEGHLRRFHRYWQPLYAAPSSRLKSRAEDEM